MWKRSWELTWRTQEEISDFNWHQLTVRLNVVTRQPQRRGGSRWSNPTQHLRAFKPVSSGAKTTWMFDQWSIFWSWRIKKCSCSNGYLKPPHGNVVSPLRRLGEWGAQLDQKTPYNLQLPLANQASQLHPLIQIWSFLASIHPYSSSPVSHIMVAVSICCVFCLSVIFVLSLD